MTSHPAGSLYHAVGRELELGADAGVGGVGVRPFGVGGKLDFTALGHNVGDGRFELPAGRGGTALRAALVALRALETGQRLLERGNLGGVHAGQFVGGRGLVAAEFQEDVGGGLFEHGAAAVELLADGVIRQFAGIAGVVFLAGAFLDILDLLCYNRKPMKMGDGAEMLSLLCS